MSRGGAQWRRFQLVVSPQDAQPAAALLETAASALSATETTADGAAVTIYTLEKTALRTSSRIRALLARARCDALFTGSQLSDTVVSEEDWATSWKQFYRPLQVAPRLFIAPSWETGFQPPSNARVIWMDPGMAFGTGQHPSTQLALKLLLNNVKAQDTVLDIGCGSGILGLAAARHGAKVFASDVDPIAVNATRDNFTANGLSAVAVRRARGIPPSFPRADVIAANISARVLVNLSAALRAALKRNGALVISGFSAHSRDQVRTALSSAGLRFRTEVTESGWLAQLYQKI